MAPKGLAPDDATFQTPICDAMNFDGLAKQDHSCKDCGKVGLALATTNHALCEPSDTPQVKLQKGVVGLVQAELHFCQFLRRPCHELQEKLVYELMLRQLELDNTILASDHKAVQGALECLKGRRKQHLGAPNTKSSKAGGIRDPVNATLIKCLDTILSVTHPISLMKSYHRCQTFFSVHEHGWKVQLANRLLEADKLFRDNKAILRGIIPKKMVDEVNARVGDYFAYSDLENPASHRGRLAGTSSICLTHLFSRMSCGELEPFGRACHECTYLTIACALSEYLCVDVCTADLHIQHCAFHHGIAPFLTSSM